MHTEKKGVPWSTMLSCVEKWGGRGAAASACLVVASVSVTRAVEVDGTLGIVFSGFMATWFLVFGVTILRRGIA